MIINLATKFGGYYTVTVGIFDWADKPIFGVEIRTDGGDIQPSKFNGALISEFYIQYFNYGPYLNFNLRYPAPELSDMRIYIIRVDKKIGIMGQMYNGQYLTVGMSIENAQKLLYRNDVGTSVDFWISNLPPPFQWTDLNA